MKFKNLEDRMLTMRSMSDYKLIPNMPVMVMLDGKNFSSKIKKQFKRPFDNMFIDLMNETAAFVCSQVQGAKIAYVQSDEISILLTDFDTPDTDSSFGFRLCKMQSIFASLATSFFNKEIIKKKIEMCSDASEIRKIINGEPLYQFDCKCWNLPTFNDVFAWFLYRQTDCIRNSKQQVSQTYLRHKQLCGKHTDEQIALLKETNGIDWNTDFNDGEKYGRFIYKETVPMSKIVIDTVITYNRSVWKSHYAKPLTEELNRNEFKMLECFSAFENKDKNIENI